MSENSSFQIEISKPCFGFYMLGPAESETLAKQIEVSIAETLCQLAAGKAYRIYRGDFQERLEALLVESMPGRSCMTTSSGTAAVEIVLRAAGVGSGDQVILSAYDYPGNFWAVERVGAFPVLVDVEPDGWQIDLSALQEALSRLPKCKAVIASHLHGQLQKSQAIRQLCDDRGVLFVEDCCQAIGARADGQAVGMAGHAAVFSFGGGKLISAGRGGALVTQEAALAQRARVAAGAGSGPYAMSELQAAIAVAQLPYLDSINRLCCRYFSELAAQLEQQHLAGGGRWLMPQAVELASETNSIYQAGCLLRPESETDQIAELDPTRATATWLPGSSPGETLLQPIVSRLPTEMRQHIGSGFPGFHRRSERRCLRISPLDNAARTSASTLVLHHRLAFESAWRASDLAAALRSGYAPK